MVGVSLVKAYQKKNIFYLVSYFMVALLVFSFSIHIGSIKISMLDVWRYILSIETTGSMRDIVWNIRLPRNLLAALVGAALAVSGALLQGVMRNPLADPQIIGVSSGAGFAGMLILILFPMSFQLLPLVSFVGALVAVVMVYALAWKNGIQPVRVILSGIAIAAFFGAGTSALMSFYSDRVQGAVSFMVGGLATKSWQEVQMVYPYIAIGLFLALLFANKMNILVLGDSTAKSLGQNVEVTRVCVTIIATLLAGAAVSVVGLLGFVGLIVPHIARLMLGNDYRILLPASMLLGAIVVTLCDTLARSMFAPFELPVGVMMGAIGAPFFLYLLRRSEQG